MARVLRSELEEQEIEDVWAALRRMPILDVEIFIKGGYEIKLISKGDFLCLC